MKWNRVCNVCEHRNDFDPLVDECPYEQNPDECAKKLLKDIKSGKDLPQIKAKKGQKNRPEIMPEPKPYYTHGDKYPDSVRVSFADGHTEIYDRRISQPSPVGYVNNSRRGKQ